MRNMTKSDCSIVAKGANLSFLECQQGKKNEEDVGAVKFEFRLRQYVNRNDQHAQLVRIFESSDMQFAET